MADVISSDAYVLGQQLQRAVQGAIANYGGLQKGSALFANAPNTKVFFQKAGVAAGTVPTGKTWVVVEFDNTTVTALADKVLTWQPPTGSMPS